LGFVALEADEYNVAATALERIVELGHLNDPKAVRFLDNIERCLAEVYKMRGDHDRVIALYLKRAEEDSTDTRCLRLLGTAYMRAGRHEEAIRVLQVATSLDGVGIGLLGNALVRAGQHQSAIDIYKNVVEKHPEKDEEWCLLGNMYWDMGNKDEAVRVFELGFERNPESISLGKRLASAYKETGKKEMAIQTMRNAAELNRTSQGGQYYGDVCLELGEPELASEAFEKFDCWWKSKATAAVAVRRYETALAVLEKEIYRYPWVGGPWDLLSSCLEGKWGARGKYEMKRKYYEGTSYLSKIPEAKK
jgi:tetratricopeptide (TPR) repeat protein